MKPGKGKQPNQKSSIDPYPPPEDVENLSLNEKRKDLYI